jgi:ketosteroid isomerase-like protein
MSEDVELVRNALQLWEARDFDALTGFADPEFAFDLSRNLDAAVYEGVEGLRAWTDQIGEMWDDFRIEPQEVFAAGDCVVSCAHVSGRGRGSGLDARMTVFQVWRLRDGRILRICGGYRSREEAVEDATERGPLS